MVLIRADANEKIGSGHVMRCLSIAKAFVQRGEEVMFVTADHRGDGLITQNGFTATCLETVWTDMELELDNLAELISRLQPKLLLVDSYYVTEQYFHVLSSYVKTAYMDDLNAVCWDVDFLINYNIFAESMDYSYYKDMRTKLLLSPKYAPLREEFRDLPAPVIKEKVTDIFVSAGGSDPEGITERIISEICPLWEGIKFHFVVGALNQRINQICELAEKYKNAVLHINEQHMAKLMSQCDLAISAAGSTLYELCACGVPTTTYTLAANQVAAAKQFERNGLMINVGDSREEEKFVKEIDVNLQRLAENVKMRYYLSQRVRKIVDGRGTERIVEAITKHLI